MYVCTFVCIYVHMYVCLYVCMNVRVCMHVCRYVLFVCMYFCLYVCICTYVSMYVLMYCGTYVYTYFRLYVGRYVLCTSVSTCVGTYVVGIATCYVLDGPRIENRWGRDFRQPSRPAVGPNSVLYSVYQVSFLAVKRPGRGVDHSPQSSTEVKERIELYVKLPLCLLDLF